MIPTSFPPKAEIARLSAAMLLEIGAVDFNSDKPFILASGLPSPAYVNCRKLISYPRIRGTLMDFLAATVSFALRSSSSVGENMSGAWVAGGLDRVLAKARPPSDAAPPAAAAPNVVRNRRREEAMVSPFSFRSVERGR